MCPKTSAFPGTARHYCPRSEAECEACVALGGMSLSYSTILLLIGYRVQLMTRIEHSNYQVKKKGYPFGKAVKAFWYFEKTYAQGTMVITIEPNN
jgi:hypothetical protein